MSRRIPFTVSFRAVTDYTVVMHAFDAEEAIDQVGRLWRDVPPAGRDRAFTRGATAFEVKTAQPNTRPYRVIVEAKAIYEIEVDAIDRQDAEEIAEDNWNAHGPDDFSFEDFDDTHFKAEEMDS